MVEWGGVEFRGHVYTGLRWVEGCAHFRLSIACHREFGIWELSFLIWLDVIHAKTQS